MIKEAVKEYFETFKLEIDSVLNGEKERVTSEIWISPEWIDLYLNSKGLEQGEFDSNGWQYDFWIGYMKNDKQYALAGSGWYGNSITFGIDD